MSRYRVEGDVIVRAGFLETEWEYQSFEFDSETDKTADDHINEGWFASHWRNKHLFRLVEVDIARRNTPITSP